MHRKDREGEGRTSHKNRERKKRLPSGKAFSFLSFFLLCLFCFPPGLVSQDSSRHYLELKIKEKKIKAEVVRTEPEKARGLMFRQKLGRDEGMLFVYEKEERLSFWMKNTPLPLSIAFLDKSGMIVDIQDLVPFSLQTHVSAFPAQYALEVNQGWFKANGISIGDTVTLPPGFNR
ncbi:MAG: hypothetical protein H6Q43_1160 [Deltaproteobacteria bacterium]|nr:hypothetical protein [Deltaproteobacteria bacterium]